ncbi:hypothetical protein RDI58_010889 [Solanum bulbocastanum]|uniref:RIN4 pathogenic type III effector avirulence factor Avr cleavage site domain-containing protein n=1 Tax=Solanum bulbocastanum TaxID=147425 RepID=A0AAN8TNR8_SOLBU
MVMMELMESCKRSSGVQIPVFGDWDKANELPITQYFESARQAGLIPHSSSQQLYFHKTQFYAIPNNVPHTKTKGVAINKKRCGGKVEKTSGPQRQTAQRPTNSKPVDEDLYKIPPHLLPGYKRKRMFGFFSRCLAPPCKA